MKTKFVVRLGAAMSLTGSIAALAQPNFSTAVGALSPKAKVVGSGPIAQPPRPPRAAGFHVKSRHLLYVALPGSGERPIDPAGDGIVVLNADNNYAFVKRIHVWNYVASMGPETIEGVAADPATNMIYLAASGRLGAVDLATDKLVWSTTLGEDAASVHRSQPMARPSSLARAIRITGSSWTPEPESSKPSFMRRAARVPTI